jgi:hypothetical protein
MIFLSIVIICGFVALEVYMNWRKSIRIKPGNEDIEKIV